MPDPPEAAALPPTPQVAPRWMGAVAGLLAGLVAVTRSGREARYALTPEPLTEAVAWIEQVGSRWDDRLAALKRHLDGSV